MLILAIWHGIYPVMLPLLLLSTVTAPLSYIFENTVYHANSAFSQKIAMRSDEQMLVMWSHVIYCDVIHCRIVISRCQSISQDNYVNGHFIISKCDDVIMTSLQLCHYGYHCMMSSYSIFLATGRFLFHGDKPLDDPSISTVRNMICMASLLVCWSLQLLPWDSERALLSWEHNEVVEVHRRRYSLKVVIMWHHVITSL